MAVNSTFPHGLAPPLPRAHLAVLVQPIKHGAIRLACQADVKAPELRHVLLHIGGADGLQEADVLCGAASASNKIRVGGSSALLNIKGG